MIAKNFHQELNKFTQFLSASTDLDALSLENLFEMTQDFNLFHSLEEQKNWINSYRAEAAHQNTTFVSLEELENWNKNEAGFIAHETGEFFEVIGIECGDRGREAGKTWHQPLLREKGNDGGILGIIRKKFDGIPHYLLQAKNEPGNYGGHQISPTLQATYSNLRMAHGGRKPRFAHYFEEAENHSHINPLFSAWVAEDGGRHFKKRNFAMLIEITDFQGMDELPEEFRWFSLYQIKQLAKENAVVNPHVRSIFSYV